MRLTLYTLCLLGGVALADPGSTLPNGYAWGCLPKNVSSGFPFCDPSRKLADRVADLVGRLTTEEKAGLMSADGRTGVSSCNMMDAGVPRLGIPNYMHLVETNTAVASTCLAPGKCSINYPGPTGLAASFNRSVWYAKGRAMSLEMRAFNNLRWYRATGDAPKSLIGLNGYGPNLNIARDPRYGRISELPGEDPFLTGSYASAMVRGGQGMDEYEAGKSKFLRMTLGLKHYDLYSVEVPRGSFIPNVTAHDLWDTYLAQYRLGFSRTDPDGSPAGGAMGTMCSYAGANGVPSCANDYLLNQVVRGHFGRPGVVVGTDCGAVNNMVSQNHYASDKVDAAAKTLNGGTDLELGDSFWAPIKNQGMGLLVEALKQGRVNQTRIDESVSRVLTLRFLTGQFDPVEDQPYTKIGADAVNSTEAQQLNLEAALQSFVLLKNENGALPFARGKTTAVLGPHVVSQRDLMSDYKGDQQCADNSYNCFPTIAQYMPLFNGADKTIVEKGVDIDSNDASGIDAALDAARKADQVLLFIGIGNGQEHEGIDRMNTSLPGLQEPFTLQVLEICKQRGVPAAVVLINGGAVAIDPVVPAAPAIVEAFYPSVRGAEALALALFGQENRWGKLPITMYDKKYIETVDFHDFDMSKFPGRTYKYFLGKPLFPFGYGLSYTNFTLECEDPKTTTPGKAGGPAWTVSCEVGLAEGSQDSSGEEVVMLFHSAGMGIRERVGYPVPIKSLVGFERVAVTGTQKVKVDFTVGPNQLGLVDADGNRQLLAGAHEIIMTNGAYNSRSFILQVTESRTLETVPKMPTPP